MTSTSVGGDLSFFMGFSVQGKVALDRFKWNSQHMMLGSIPCSSDLPGSHGFDDEEEKT